MPISNFFGLCGQIWEPLHTNLCNRIYRRIQIQKSNFPLRYFDLLIAFFAATLPFVLGKKLPRAHHNFWTRSRLFLYGAVFILESSQRC